MQVAALQNQSLCSSERLKAMSEKNQELSAETQKTYEDNHLLNKCVGELSVVCKRKQATLEQLSRYIQTADKLSDIPLPPIEQVRWHVEMLHRSCGHCFRSHAGAHAYNSQDASGLSISLLRLAPLFDCFP